VAHSSDDVTKMRCLVTGAAGFIGSHLAQRLLADGHQVIGLDAFTDYYGRAQKEENLGELRRSERFQFVEMDLLHDDLTQPLDQVDLVFHMAAQPGVRASWGAAFAQYVELNIVATQRLLDAVRGRKLTKLVYASSSSVYGDAESFPTPEVTLPKPISPYGVSKLAGEHLCYLYWRQYGVPTVSLRYFTVYGPRQRPDMAFHRFIRSYLENGDIDVFGDGEQIRDYTYVTDAVDATVRAAFRGDNGSVFNVGGGDQVTVNAVLSMLSGLTSGGPVINRKPAQDGDARRTCADIRRARERLGYVPVIGLLAGLQSEVAWLRARPRMSVPPEGT